MSFIKGGLIAMSPLGGLVDGKPGAFSQLPSTKNLLLGGMLGGKLLDKIGKQKDPGNNGGEGLTPLSRRPRYGRGAAALSQDGTTGGL